MDAAETITDEVSILIVDDMLTNLQLLSSLLKRKGYIVQAVTNGALALETIQKGPPALVLLDICMPGINGYEVCRQLKANPATVEIPVIFISAMDEPMDKVKAFRAGGVDYITKPFQVAEVMARVENHLTIRRLQMQLQKQNEQLQREVRDRLATEAALQIAIQELQWMAHSDSLTQLANRRRFDEYLDQEWTRMRREQQPLSLILCDVDFFKSFNDTYGHQKGDICLQKVAQAIRAAAKRTVDLVARYGGEEFAVILPNTPLEGALSVAQEIQQRVLTLNLPHARSPISHSITLSLGITTLTPQSETLPTDLISAADRALYQAKLDGRDRIAVELNILP